MSDADIKPLLTPVDVNRVEFDTRWRGYDTEQVDMTLDALERTIGSLSTTLMAFARKNHDLETRLRMTLIDNRRLREKLKDSQERKSHE